MRIVIQDFNPGWEVQFENEKKTLTDALSGRNVCIEHIGSTSVKGLGAKPVIDIMIGLGNFKLADRLIPEIEKSGYTYIAKYETTMPFRRFFTKRQNEQCTHHIHLVEIGSEFWLRHLAFRNHLRANKVDRDNYYELKRALSLQDWKDGNEYANAKSEFIRNIERKAMSG